MQLEKEIPVGSNASWFPAIHEQARSSNPAPISIIAIFLLLQVQPWNQATFGMLLCKSHVPMDAPLIHYTSRETLVVPRSVGATLNNALNHRKRCRQVTSIPALRHLDIIPNGLSASTRRRNDELLSLGGGGMVYAIGFSDICSAAERLDGIVKEPQKLALQNRRKGWKEGFDEM